MVIGQIKQLESSPNPAGLRLVQLSNKAVGADDVRNPEVPAWHVGRAIREQGGHADVLSITDRARAVGEVVVYLQPGRIGGHGRRVIKLAIITKSQPMLKHIVPDEAGRGISERVIAERVAAAEAAKRLLKMVRAVGFGGPGMAVG